MCRLFESTWVTFFIVGRCAVVTRCAIAARGTIVSRDTIARPAFWGRRTARRCLCGSNCSANLGMDYNAPIGVLCNRMGDCP